MSNVVAPSSDSIRLAAEHLAAGRLVGMPTETVYGLAANATDAAAVAKIFQVKGRPANNPLIVHVANAAAAKAFIRIDHSETLQRQWEIATQFWPGSLTIVVPRSDRIPDIVTAGGPAVAIRVPDHSVALDLLAACRFPLAAPSANRSNYISPTRASHVADLQDHAESKESVAMILDGGECRCGVESTIIRLVESGPQCLRYGGIPLEAIEQAFGAVIARPSSSVTPTSSALVAMPAPGMMVKHYSPKTPLCLADDWDPVKIPAERVARIAFRPLLDHESSTAFLNVDVLSENGDLVLVARNLFASLRDADLLNADLIVIDTCHRDGIGAAIMDRIDRAVAG